MHRTTQASPDTAVIEWAPFRLAAGADDSALLNAADAVQRDFIRHQPGFVRRELLRESSGEWVDLIVWEDDQSAAAAMKAAGSSEICMAYFQLMAGGDSDDFGADVRHLQRVRAY